MEPSDLPEDLPPELRDRVEQLKRRAENGGKGGPSLLREKIAVEGWEDTRDAERQLREGLDQRIAGYQDAIRLCDGVLQIRNQPGWREFVQVLQDWHQSRLRELEGAKEPNAMLRLQGRAQELAGILALVRQTEVNREALAAEVDRLQTHRRSIERPTEVTK